MNGKRFSDRPSLVPPRTGRLRRILHGLRPVACGLLLSVFCVLPTCVAQVDVPERRVFVPVEDLDTIINKDQRGVVLPRDEFQKLSEAARKNASKSPAAPASVVITDANYSAHFVGEQLFVTAQMKLTQLREGWQIVTLPLAGMSIESARLNDQAARIGRNEQGLLLLNDTLGEHTLDLELSTPLTAVGADKVASLGVLPGIAGTLKVAVVAGKFLQIDGLTVERPAPADQPATYSLAVGGQRTAVVLQLTDRQRERSTDSLLFATTGFGLRVAPGEVTWHAVTNLQVHGTALDRLVCRVPKTLEITDVDSSGLEAWELSDDPNDASATRITLNYRQPFDGARRVDFRGVMAVPAGESWQVPTLKINQVTSHIGRALVQHAPAVRLRTVEASGVRTATVSDADLKQMGTSGATDPGQITLLFDVWREDFLLGFVAQPKEQDVQASISSIFDLTASGLDLITAATIETSFAPLFDIEVSLPAEWLLTSVKVNGQPLPWTVRTREDEPGINHIRVALPQPLRPGTGSASATLEVRAHHDPDGWPVEDQPLNVALPELRLTQSSVTEGTYVIKADADLDVVPGEISGLDPSHVPVPGARLGFAYQDTRFNGHLIISRRPSRVSVRTLTFARLDKQTQYTHFEADLEIQGGGLRALDVELPASAGKDLRFAFANGLARVIEQTSRDGENGQRVWTLRLDRHLVGHETLVVTSVVPRSSPLPLGEGGRRPGEGTEQSNAAATNTGAAQPGSLTPAISQRERGPSAAIMVPFLRVLAADRQNGFIALEAEGDQRLTIVAQDGNQASLTEVDPIDLPAPRAYFPQHRIVAAYRYFADLPTVAITDERFDRLPVPTAICRLATIRSVLSPAGEFQHQATFQFTAVGVQSLRVKFGNRVSPLPLGEGGRRPGEGSERSESLAMSKDDRPTTGSLTLALSQGERGPDSQLATHLWAALIDGQPVEVRRADGAFLIPLRSGDDPTTERTLTLFYRTQVPALRGKGQLRQPPPELTVLNGAGVSQPMQVLDQQWELSHPRDVLLTDSLGAFVPDANTPLDRTNWLANVPQSLSLPNRWTFSRAITVCVLVFIAVAFVWSRYRFGWLRGVVAPGLLLFVVSLFLLPKVQQAREAARRNRPASGAVTYFGPADYAHDADAVQMFDAPQTAEGVTSMTADPFGAKLPAGGDEKSSAPVLTAPMPPQAEAAQKEVSEARTREPQARPDADDEFANRKSDSSAKQQTAKKGFSSRLADGRTLRSEFSKAGKPDDSKSPASGKKKYIPVVGAFAVQYQEVPFDTPGAITEEEMLAQMRFGLGADGQQRARGATAADPNFAPVDDSRSLILDEVVGQALVGSGGRGLLSLTMALEAQEGAATKKFRYLGTDTAASGIGLELTYENRAAGWGGRWLWIAVLAFLAWLLPAERRTWRNTWGVLGLTLPLALAAIAPQAWQSTLDGMFFGTVAAVALWLLRGAGERLADLWPRMKTKSFWLRPLGRTATGLWLTLLAVNSVSAQPEAPPAPPAAPNPNVPAIPTIIVPYDDPKEPLAAERVYLPHAKFVELWNRAHPDLKKPVPAPWHGQVTEALFVVAPKERPQGDESALAEVRGRITFFAGQPMWVPLPLKNGVLTETKLDDQSAATTVLDIAGESRVAVYLAKAGLHVLDLSAELPIQQAGPAGQLTLQLAPVPAGKLLFVNDGEEIAFRVNGATNTFRVRQGSPATKPNEAAGEAPQPVAEQRSNAASLLQRIIHGQGAKETYYEVAINAGGDLRLAWQPKQAAGAVDAIVQAESATAVQVEDAGVRIESGWQFKVPRGSINDIAFSLPTALKVRSIAGPDVGGWELVENVDGRVLRVFLRRAVSDQTSLNFELFVESQVADEPVPFQLPAFAPLQVTRDFGLVGVFAQPQFAVKNVTTKTVTQINANQFPASGVKSQGSLIVGQPQSAFRYTSRPFEIGFTAQRRVPESTGFAEHALVLERRKLRMSSRLRWELAGALRSSVSVQLPFGWLPIDVDATALADWHIAADTNILTVEFTEPRIGVVEVVLQGSVPKEPDDSIAEIYVPTPLELSKLTTQAAIWFDPAYQATVSAASGWKGADPDQCSEELRNKLGRPAKFLFNTNAITPEVLGFDIVRAQPKLTADAVSFVTVLDTAVDYSLAMQWNISEAAADTFTFTTPDWLAGKLDFQGAAIRQTSFAPVGDNTPRTRWTVTLQDPVSSRYFLLATATLPPPTRREVVAPTITFESREAQPDAAAEGASFQPLEQQRQFVVAINISRQQLAPVGEVGQPVPRDELPIVVDQRLVDQATAVLRVRNATAPRWSLKSFTAQAGAPASVNLADLTTVIAADGTWRMKCVYTIKNRARQFLALQLPEQSQALSVFVANQPSRLVEFKKDSRHYQLIALPKTSEADLSFQVRLVLAGRLAEGALPRGLTPMAREFDVPAPIVVSQSDDKEYGIPVARTLWSVHVPREWSAKAVNDPSRNNLNTQADDTAVLAYQATWLQEANELLRIIEGLNPSSQKLQARNNLKQLGLALHNYESSVRTAQSEEGRKLAQSLREFEAKQRDLESRVIVEMTDEATNFYVAKDQQQAAQARSGQTRNEDLFFDQLGQNDEVFQRSIVDNNNRKLFLQNSTGVVSEDRNGNGVLDPGEDLNGDGLLNFGDVTNVASATGSSSGTLRFKLNAQPAEKPTSTSTKRESDGKWFQQGKVVTELDRANRRQQAVEQLDQLNRAVDAEKLSLQIRQSQTINAPAQPAEASPNAQGQPQVPPFAQGSFGAGDALAHPTPGQGIPNEARGVRGTATRAQPSDSGRGGGMGGFGGGQQSGTLLGMPGTNASSGTHPNAGYIMAGDVADGLVALNTVGGLQAGTGWTQAGGLSLPIEIPAAGNVLKFSRASGTPRLAIAVRPNAADTLGLGLVWVVVWVGIGVWLLRVVAGTTSRQLAGGQLAGGLSVLGLLGMFFFPTPLNDVCVGLFASATIVLAIGVLRRRRQNVAA
jgi:hypothetical protein